MTYFWYPYIPFGALTVIEGIPGAGKTRLVLDLISRASTGAPLPGPTASRPDPTHATLLGCGGPVTSRPDPVTSHLDPTTSLHCDGQPRCDGLPSCGDQLRCGGPTTSLYCGYLDHQEQAQGYLYKSGASLDRVAYPTRNPGIRLLREAILETRARLVVIDPAEYFFDDNPDRNELHQLAEETGVALILTSYNGGIAAPSILHVKRGDMALHYLRHLKSPAGRRGDDHAFGFRKDGKIDWLYHCRRISAIGECDLEAEFWQMYAPEPQRDRHRRAPERSFPHKRPMWTRT